MNESVVIEATAKLRTAVDRLVYSLEARIVALEADVSRLEKENAELWSTVHEFQDARENI